ncbi:rod shape-determining protein MreD [Paludibacter sp.]|uniref:rod shape-determining protein MreD n=1 Tax=Paludibacter sp. TaxID=1898105 RepID=UPI0013549857|nr:rod shape-determining protein MreD [Paludibacter sp.]MTK53460.1 rod shape-determining protein MreD [Paludibacter sp.]
MSTNLVLKHTLRFIVLVLLQVLIFNNIRFLGYVNPLIYIWFIISFPTGVNRSLTLLVAFLMGAVIDIFSNTPGMYAFATVFVAFARKDLLQLFVPKDMYANYEPSVKVLGLPIFLKYVTCMVIVLHLLLFTLEAFSFQHYWLVLLKTAINSVVTILLVLSTQKFK